MIRSNHLALALALTFGAASAAEAHAFLDHAEPAVGSNLKKAPADVRIWFSEPVASTSSRISVFDPSGKRIDKGDTHPDSSDKSLLQVSLPQLPPGLYKVVWRAVSADSHVTEGDFTFQVSG